MRILPAAVVLALLLSGCMSRSETPAPPTMTQTSEGLVPTEPGGWVQVGNGTHLPPEPPQPYHESWHLNGTALTGDPITGWNMLHCGDCTRDVAIRDGLAAIIVEARMDNQTLPTPGTYPEFYYHLEGPPPCSLCPFNDFVVTGSGGNPMRDERTEEVPYGTYVFRVGPQTWVPETARPFEAVLTAFYHAPPPEGWSAWAE